MLTKSETLAAIAKELRIVAHLAAKLKPQHLAFRLTPPQRSTQELLEYLAVTAEGIVSFYLTGTWGRWEALEQEVEGKPLERLRQAIDGQRAAVEQLLAPFDEAAFAAKRVKTPQGVELPLPEALFEGIVKQLVGYKMQLFLQAKAAGLAELGSANLWRGEDPAAKAQ